MDGHPGACVQSVFASGRWCRRRILSFLVLPACALGALLLGPAPAALADQEPVNNTIPGEAAPSSPINGTLGYGLIDRDWNDVYHISLPAGKVLRADMQDGYDEPGDSMMLYAQGQTPGDEILVATGDQFDRFQYLIPESGEYYFWISYGAYGSSYTVTYSVEEVSISGTVSDAAGGPIAGVQVTATSADGMGQWGATSDANGFYFYSGLQDGEYRLSFEKSGYTKTYYKDAYDFASAADVAVVSGSPVTGIDTTLRQLGSIAGTVKNHVPAGLPGIQIYAYRSAGADQWEWGGSATTNLDGTYSIGGLKPGKYALRFHDDAGTYAEEYYNNQPERPGSDLVSVEAATETGAIDVTMEAAAHICGSVTVGGSGVAGEDVLAYRLGTAGDWSLCWTTTKTDSQGHYDLGGLSAGAYRVRFQDETASYPDMYYDGAPSLGTADAIALTAGETRDNVNADLRGWGHIAGTVTDGHGALLENASVTCTYVAEDGSSMWGGSASTNAEGRYDIGGLPTEDYVVRFLDYPAAHVAKYFNNHTEASAADLVHVEAGSTTDGIDAALDDAGGISGTVTAAGGAELSEITVTAFRSDGMGGWEQAAEGSTWEGHYQLDGLLPGDYHVRFRSAFGDYFTGWYDDQPDEGHATPVTVVAGSVHESVDAVLAAAGHITGTLTNEDDSGLSSLAVTAYRPDGSGGWEVVAGTETDGSGNYDLTGLVTGNYRVGFDGGSGYLDEYYSDAATADGATDVDVTAGATHAGINAVLADAGHITGTVRSVAGFGIDKIAVTVFGRDGTGEWRQFAAATTNWGGFYDIGGLPTGDYHVGFDGGDSYFDEYYDDESDLSMAAGVSVVAGSSSRHIDAVLDPITKPSSSCSYPFSPSASSGWHRSDQTFTIVATQGSGTDLKIHYSINNGTNWDTVDGRIADVRIDHEGSYRVIYYASDSLSAEARHVAGYVNADWTPPVTTDDHQATMFAPAVITLTPRDSLSGMSGGLAGTEHMVGSGAPYMSGTVVTLPFGQYGVAYRSTDAAGNVEIEHGFAVTVVEPTPPASQSSYDFAGSATTDWKSSAQTVTITASAGSGSGLTIHYSTSGGESWSTAAGTSVDVAISGQGSHQILYYASDSLSQESAHEAGYVNIDLTPPTTTDDHLTASLVAPATITLTPADPLSGMRGGSAETEYKIDGQPEYSQGTAVTLAMAGTHTVSYRSTDAAGNTESPDKQFTVNVTEPARPVLSPTSSCGDSFAASAVSGWRNTPQTVSFTAAPGSGQGLCIRYSVDGGVSWSSVVGTAAVATISSQGSHHCMYYAADSLSEEAPRHDPGYVNIDTAAPRTQATKASVRRGKRAALRYRVTDVSPGCGSAAVNIQILRRGKVVKRITVGKKATNTLLVYKGRITLKQGAYVWRVAATDAAGNKALKTTGARLTVK